MALAYLFDPNMQFQDRNGVNNVAGFLRVYYEGTDDRATTYKNFIGTLNPADIPIDNDGRSVVIVEDEKTYRLEVYARNGNLLWTQHPLCPLVGGGGSFEQVQSNWDEDDPTSAAFIKNKPELSAVATSGSYDDLSDKPILVAQYGETTYNQVSRFAFYVGKTAVCSKQSLTAVLIDDDGYSFTFATPPNVEGQYHVFTLHNDNSWTDRIIERTHDLICQLKPIVYLGSTSMRHILCDRQKYIIEQGYPVFLPVDVYQLATWINRGDVIQIDGAAAHDPWGDRYPMQITEMQCSTDSGTNKLYCSNIAVRGYAYSQTEIFRWGDVITDEATNTKYLEFQTWT